MSETTKPLPTAPQMKRFLLRCRRAQNEIDEAIGSIKQALEVFDADSIPIKGNPFTGADNSARTALGALEAAALLLAHADDGAEKQRKMARRLARSLKPSGTP